MFSGAIGKDEPLADVLDKICISTGLNKTIEGIVSPSTNQRSYLSLIYKKTAKYEKSFSGNKMAYRDTISGTHYKPLVCRRRSRPVCQ
jgi:hypothetical protein